MKVGDISEVLRVADGLPDPEAGVVRPRPRRCRSSRRASRSATASSRRSGARSSKSISRNCARRRSSSGRTRSSRRRTRRPASRLKSGVACPRRNRPAPVDRSHPAVVRHLDALAPRAGGPRAARTEADRRLPADDPPLEPLEGSQEEDRLAAVSRAIASRGSIRPTRCRSSSAPASSTSSRSRGNRRRFPDVRARQHPAAGRQRAAVRSLPADSMKA